MSYRREECKIWAKIPREDLEVICHELAYHYDALLAFAAGATIEEKHYGEEVWRETENPCFYISADYRIKTFNPKQGEVYFYIFSDGKIVDVEWTNDLADGKRINFGNCFKTRAEAEAARERVIKALKGDRTK